MKTEKATILIVEDEVGSRDSLQMILRPFSNVYCAENGHMALEMLAERKFDLVTLDLRLPGIQGVDLLREIKRQKPDVEVIIITGYGSLKSAMDGIRYGAAGYLLKPFNVAELLDVVNKTWGKKRRLDALRGFLSNIAMLEKPSQGSEANYLQFVRVLANTLDNKDRFTYNHSLRVNVYANLIADRLNLSTQERDGLELGAFLHDIGKIGIANEIIFKAAKLSEQEFEMIKKHPAVGSELIAPLQLPLHIISIIRHHHERYDGKGYPDGLRGDQIPLLARIISLAESLDAMVSDRPYRKALSFEEVVAELRRCSGTQWDPLLVDALLEIIAEKGEEMLGEAIDPEHRAVGA